MRQELSLTFAVLVTFTICVMVVFNVNYLSSSNDIKVLMSKSKKTDVTKKWNESSIDDDSISRAITGDNLVDSLVFIAKGIHTASVHAKSLKTIHSLRIVEKKLSTMLKSFNIDYNRVVQHKVNLSKTVCPEEFRGAQHGFPTYQKGFETQKCSYNLPLSKLLSVVYVPDEQIVNLNLDSISFSLPDVHVYIGGRSQSTDKVKYKSIKIFRYSGDNMGNILNDLLSKVHTEYVLIARDVYNFDKQMRVERLIREIQMLEFDAVGGATRTDDGKWKIGCYQSGRRNYTQVYHEGYDESVHECLVCDMIQGPFVIKANLIKNLKFDRSLPNHTIFEDMFLRLGLERTLVCPDSMFHVNVKQYPVSASSWIYFAKKWELYKIKFVPGFEIMIPCSEPYKCNKGKYFLVSPCCVLQLAEMTKHVMKVCTEHNVICELNSGTLLSAVKMGHTAPWDIDGDVMFTLWNASAIHKLEKEFAGSEYKFRVQSPAKYEGFRAVFAAFEIRTRYWFVEIYGKAMLTSENYILNGRGQTLVCLHGNWVSTPANPGLWVRNRYGKEVYRHANNWRHLGKKGSLEQYPTDAFIPCSNPGNPKCLDNYRTDGNLQFSDPIP